MGVTSVDDELGALPSYAMRRSTAASSVAGLAAAAAMAAPLPQGLGGLGGYGGHGGGGHVPARPVPAHFQPRSLGGHPSLLVQGGELLAGGAEAAGLADWRSSLHAGAGMSRAGGVLAMAAAVGATQPLRGMGLGQQAPAMSFSLSVSPEFKVVRVGGAAPGGGLLGPSPASAARSGPSSMSLAAHTAAATRQRSARGQP
jgi:hypothetical protein